MKNFIAYKRATANNALYADPFVAENVSDGYHTFDELYDHRLALNVALFNLIYQNNTGLLIYKSKFHNDGTMFNGGYFIVAMLTLNGQISYHYKMEHWDKFKIPEIERIPWIYDGHTPNDCIERLLKL